MTKLNISEDFVAVMDLDDFKTASGQWADGSALTGVRYRIAATKTGDAIGGLAADAAESGSTAAYYAIFDTAALVTDLTAYLGEKVYLILSIPGDMNKRWVPFEVVDNAPI
jgi:hypothetical protein